MYKAARCWGLQPNEFWEMSLAEWLCESEMAIERADRMPMPGRKHLTRADAKRLADDLDLTDEEWRERQRNGRSST